MQILKISSNKKILIFFGIADLQESHKTTCMKNAMHGVNTSTGGLLLAFMLLEQLFKAAPCGLVRDSVGTPSFSFFQTAHYLKYLVEI